MSKIPKEVNVFFHDHFVDRDSKQFTFSDPVRFYTNKIWAIDREDPDAWAPEWKPEFSGVNFNSVSRFPPLAGNFSGYYNHMHGYGGKPGEYGHPDYIMAQLLGGSDYSEVDVVTEDWWSYYMSANDSEKDAWFLWQNALKLDVLGTADQKEYLKKHNISYTWKQYLAHIEADHALKLAFVKTIKPGVAVKAEGAKISRLNWEIHGPNWTGPAYEQKDINQYGTVIRYPDDNELDPFMANDPQATAAKERFNLSKSLQWATQNTTAIKEEFFFKNFKNNSSTSIHLGSIKEKLFAKLGSSWHLHYLNKLNDVGDHYNTKTPDYRQFLVIANNKKIDEKMVNTHKLMKVTMEKSNWFYDYNFLYRPYTLGTGNTGEPRSFRVIRNVHKYNDCLDPQQNVAMGDEARLQMFYENHMQRLLNGPFFGTLAKTEAGCEYQHKYTNPSYIALAADTLKDPHAQGYDKAPSLKEKMEYPFYNTIYFTPQFGVAGFEDIATRQTPVMLGSLVSSEPPAAMYGSFEAFTHGAFRQHSNEEVANESDGIKGFICEAGDPEKVKYVTLKSRGDYVNADNEIEDQFNEATTKKLIYGEGDGGNTSANWLHDVRLKWADSNELNLPDTAQLAFKKFNNALTDELDYISPYVTYAQAQDSATPYSQKFARNEIVAYKIVKRAENGDAANDLIVSNIYVFPNFKYTGTPQIGIQHDKSNNIIFSGPGRHEYVDTQVKYNEKYSYRFYAVVLVYGKRYRYRNIECKLPSLEYFKEIEAYPTCKELTENEQSDALLKSCKDCKEDPKCIWNVHLPGEGSRKDYNSEDEAYEADPDNWKRTHPDDKQDIQKVVPYGDGVWQRESQEFDFSALVEEQPSMRFVEIPLLAPQSWNAADASEFDPKNQTISYSPQPSKADPPLPPLLTFFPFKGVNNKISISFGKGLGNRVREYDKAARDKYDWPENVPAIGGDNDNDGDEDNMVLFSGASAPVKFLLYRITEAPQSWDDFGVYGKSAPEKNTYKVINKPSEIDLKVGHNAPLKCDNGAKECGEVGQLWDTAHLIDELKPNQKYYYMARTISVEGEVSYPSVVYSVEIVDDGGVVMPIIETVEFEDTLEAKKYKRKKSILFKEKLRIDPSFLQVVPQKDGSLGLIDSSQSPILFKEQKKAGTNGDDPWDNKHKLPSYKLRITSTKTKRRVDLNITFRSRKLTSQKDDAWNFVLNEGEVVRSGTK